MLFRSVAYARNPTLTPAELEASGARVIGHISGSLLMDLHPNLHPAFMLWTVPNL